MYVFNFEEHEWVRI